MSLAKGWDVCFLFLLQLNYSIPFSIKLAALPHLSAVTVISNGKINAFTSISVTEAADYSLTPISRERGEARGPSDKGARQA